VEITPNVVKRYQADRLNQKAGPKTINDEVQLLLRLCGEQGVLIRATLRRDKALKLPLPPSPGRPYSAEQKARMLEEAQKLRTPQMHAALALDLNTVSGIRNCVRSGGSRSTWFTKRRSPWANRKPWRERGA